MAQGTDLFGVFLDKPARFADREDDLGQLIFCQLPAHLVGGATADYDNHMFRHALPPAYDIIVGAQHAMPLQFFVTLTRDVQGAALHPQSGQLWTHEYGPQGGDEVNIILPDRNYGWPVLTHRP